MITVSQGEYNMLKSKSDKLLKTIFDCDKHGIYECNNCSVELSSCKFYLKDILDYLSRLDFSDNGYLQKRLEYLEVTINSIPLIDKGDTVSLISRYTVAHDLVCFILIELEMYIG